MTEEKFRNGCVDENGIKWMKSRCFFCHSHCSMFIGSKDGKIVKMVPNEEDCFSGMCGNWVNRGAALQGLPL